MSDWRIERLSAAHQRNQFACGQAPLDDFLRHLVNQYEKRDLGRTYVALPRSENRVSGYYTIASSSVSFQNLSPSACKKLPRHPVPVILLARLAVDLSVQGRGLGGILLFDALARSLELAGALGVHAIEVHAVDDGARAFYEKFGFMPLLDSSFHLYLPIAVVRSLQKEP